MFKHLLTITFILFTVNFLSAQDMTMEELKAKKAELSATQSAKQAEADAFQGEIDALTEKITILSGWRTGFSGVIGLTLGGSNKWIANANPTSSSAALSIGVTGFANKNTSKYLWNNKLIANKAWQDIDILEEEDDKLFDLGTVDILNISSLYGYKISSKLAVSALGELNTSLGNFLKPGTFDIGVGVTWTPITNLVVVIHPLNYNITWPADGEAESTGSLGTKIRADYQDNFAVRGNKIAWSTTLSAFLPYNSDKTTLTSVDKYGATIFEPGTTTALTREAGLANYTWLNTLSFQVWKGIGVGFTFGVRKSDFEFEDLQTFYTLGLSYAL